MVSWRAKVRGDTSALEHKGSSTELRNPDSRSARYATISAATVGACRCTMCTRLLRSKTSLYTQTNC